MCVYVYVCVCGLRRAERAGNATLPDKCALLVCIDMYRYRSISMCMCAPSTCMYICKYIDMCVFGLHRPQRTGNGPLPDECAPNIYIYIYIYIYIDMCIERYVCVCALLIYVDLHQYVCIYIYVCACGLRRAERTWNALYDECALQIYDYKSMHIYGRACGVRRAQRT